jgi:hypothetical protein
MKNKVLSSGLIGAAFGITCLVTGPAQRNPLADATSTVLAGASSRVPNQLGAAAHAHSFRRTTATKPNAGAGSSLRVPLDFEANQGQAPAEYAFVAHGPSYAMALSSTQIALSLHRASQDNHAHQFGAARDSRFVLVGEPVNTGSISNLYSDCCGSIREHIDAHRQRCVL